MSILEDLELNLREHFAKDINDYLDLCIAANIPYDEMIASLLYNVGYLHSSLINHFTKISPIVFGEMCARSLDRAQRSSANAK